MCPGCGRVWTVLHVIWSIVYVACGAAQLVAGIFFFISYPELYLSCNIWTGSWNIVIGIIAGMVVCFGQLSPRRQEVLLYMAISILSMNAVNAVLSEWGFYWEDITKQLEDQTFNPLNRHACFATRVAAATVIIISFLDSQLAFCSLQTTQNPNKKKLRGSHEQVSDIEYIIPRQKSSKHYSAHNEYAQSWVFEADNASCSNHTESPYLKISQNGTPKIHEEKPTVEIENTVLNDTAHLIDNPVVHVEEASDDSTSNSDRKLNHMKSFSRSASPVVLSASSSQLSLNVHMNNPPIYECLERLTEPSVYRSRLNSALSNKEEEEQQQHYQSPQPMMMRRVETKNPQSEKVQYASLMKELQKAIVSKKDLNASSPQSTSDSATTSEKTQTNSKCSSRQESSRTDGKNSDAEFSKELEAALQLIQDLESPNTIDTPSEAKSFDGKELRPVTVWRNSNASESEKTLSAVGSLAELTSPITECQPELYTFKPTILGKGARIIIHSESQSTSGYSSPTQKSNSHTPDWSTTSSVNGSNNDLGKHLSYSIHNSKSTAVISLYSQDTLKSKGKSVTLVTISGNNEPVNNRNFLQQSTFQKKRNSDNNLLHNHAHNGVVVKCVGDEICSNKSSDEPKTPRRLSLGNGNMWNVKSILRKKKQHNLPKLCPELEGAIVKSESLAYLTELELLARHQRNKDIQREIEQRVLQQLGTPRTDSKI